ncbi:hypothetical protein HNO89_003556 [Sporosarcina luteola]|nr:hypothetical protein [Sporosarcina luteola]
MTQFYFISSKSSLATGVFGEVKQQSEKGNMIFQTCSRRSIHYSQTFGWKRSRKFIVSVSV